MPHMKVVTMKNEREHKTRRKKNRQNIDVQSISFTMNARRVVVCMNRRLAKKRERKKRTNFPTLFSLNRFARIRFCSNDTN